MLLKFNDGPMHNNLKGLDKNVFRRKHFEVVDVWIVYEVVKGLKSLKSLKAPIEAHILRGYIDEQEYYFAHSVKRAG